MNTSASHDQTSQEMHSSVAADAGSPRTRHEPTQLRGRTILLWTAGLALLVIASLATTRGLSHLLRGTTAPVRTKAARGEPLAPSSGVELNPNQAETRRAYEQRQEELLSQYEFTNPEGGTGRIPIERAMEIIVTRAEQTRAARENEGEQK